MSTLPPVRPSIVAREQKSHSFKSGGVRDRFPNSLRGMAEQPLEDDRRVIARDDQLSLPRFVN